jgi:hypothetical protein
MMQLARNRLRKIPRYMEQKNWKPTQNTSQARELGPLYFRSSHRAKKANGIANL